MYIQIEMSQEINQEKPWRALVIVGKNDDIIKELGERSRKSQFDSDKNLTKRLDYEFSGPGGGINHRRMFALRRRMGVS